MNFKIGFEIHQRLDTHKLFCECPSEEANGQEIVVTRRLRPVMSETGDIDRAAMLEYQSGKFFEYHAPLNSSCLVELDEEPPHQVNKEALEIILQIVKLFDAKPVEEVHPMRKIVIDGSNTSGFQRTMLIARDGTLGFNGKKISIPTIYLEEESAFIVEKKQDRTVYRLDRLGIPLVELSTGVIEGVSPEEARDIALRIGRLLRATGKVKRGIGTIRQDINISIPGGARVEIKGAQDLDLMPEIIRREVTRQSKLLFVKNELEKKGIGKVEARIVDLTDVFKGSKCGFIRKSKVVYGVKAPGFAGILGEEVQPGRRVGTEVSDYAKKAGVGGIIHSDEDLSKYPVTSEEVANVMARLGAKEGDAFILVASDPGKARNALKLAVERINMLFEGVPEEVRKVLPDGNTAYMRPMPGAARLYPETDVEPFIIDRTLWDRVKTPELPEETESRLVRMGVPKELATSLVNSGDFVLFDKIVSSTGADPKLVAVTLENTRRSLRREGVDVDSITEEQWIEVFKRKIPKEAVPEVIKAITTDGLSALNKFSGMSEEEARNKVREIISSIPDLSSKRNPFSVAMGEVMKELRGKVDGKVLARLVREELGNK